MHQMPVDVVKIKPDVQVDWRTSQMKVNESCQRAFFGSKIFAPVVATKAMAATPAREYAEVAVNISGPLDVMV